jgi:hypothetical protein
LAGKKGVAMRSRLSDHSAQDDVEMRLFLTSLGLGPEAIDRALKTRLKRSDIHRPDRLGKKPGRPRKEKTRD